MRVPDLAGQEIDTPSRETYPEAHAYVSVSRQDGHVGSLMQDSMCTSSGFGLGRFAAFEELNAAYELLPTMALPIYADPALLYTPSFPPLDDQHNPDLNAAQPPPSAPSGQSTHVLTCLLHL